MSTAPLHQAGDRWRRRDVWRSARLIAGRNAAGRPEKALSDRDTPAVYAPASEQHPL